MRYLVVCIDKNSPENSDLAADDDTDEALVFGSEVQAKAWIELDQSENPGDYSYHLVPLAR